MNGKRLPFFVVKYTDGTLCPIVGNKPREINVFYSMKKKRLNTASIKQNIRLN